MKMTVSMCLAVGVLVLGSACGTDATVTSDVMTQRTEPDAATPEPDVSTPEPDVTTPEPDVAMPQPDVATSEPDASDVLAGDAGSADSAESDGEDIEAPSQEADTSRGEEIEQSDGGDAATEETEAEVSDAGAEQGETEDEALDTVGDESETDSEAEDTESGPSDVDEQPEPPNLIENPGFEDGEAPWSIWGGAARTQGNARSGQWAVEATSVNGAEQLIVGLEPDAIYRLSGWGKVSGPDGLSLGVKNYGGDQVVTQFTTSEYTEGTVEFTTGFGNTTAVIFAYKHSGPEPGWADDVRLEYVGPSGREPVWSDEFEDDGPLDESKWTFEAGFVRNQELQWYQPENAFIEDGVLVIEGREEEFPNPNYVAGSTDWKTSREMVTHTSASVTTKGLYAWQYGHLVVRAKVTNLTGTWPAIWTVGETCNWPSNGEIDVMENYGGDILANFAWGTNTPWSPNWDSSHWPVADFDPEWTERFHIWELDWNEERMVIRLDGAVLNEVALSQTINGSAVCAGQNPFMQPHQLLLNLALGGAGGSVENLSFPTRYLVDYVRIYE